MRAADLNHESSTKRRENIPGLSLQDVAIAGLSEKTFPMQADVLICGRLRDCRNVRALQERKRSNLSSCFPLKRTTSFQNCTTTFSLNEFIDN
jgi:hypothetical protein